MSRIKASVESVPYEASIPFLYMVLVVKNLPADAGDIRDVGSLPGSGRSPRGGNGNPLQCSCLENPMEEEPGGLQSIGL